MNELRLFDPEAPAATLYPPEILMMTDQLHDIGFHDLAVLILKKHQQLEHAKAAAAVAIEYFNEP